MQVARANVNLPSSAKASVESQTRLASSYAPLYLSTTLRNESFDIEDLEAISLDRLRLLKSIERSKATLLSTSGKLDIPKHRATIRAAERSHGINIPLPKNIDRDARVMKDEASHFLLRLALCRSHEHRQFLLSTECDLFSTRLEHTGIEFALHTISKANGPKVEKVSMNEIEQYRFELDSVARGVNRMRAGDTGITYYKVAFEQVSSLVRNRKVFLKNGFAYVPERNVVDIVSSQFRYKLSAGLMMASKVVAKAENDKRMRPILESIRQHFPIEDENGKKRNGFNMDDETIDKINLNDMNKKELVLDCMPLCMQTMLYKFRENHHLRYSARLQLGVFLKGCGLTMDESLKFWKVEFGKGDVNGDKFEKMYSYNIRHHYGKEGKRRNLQPFQCMKVINDRPGPGEYNGCPYREMQPMRLKQAVSQLIGGGDREVVDKIVEQAGQGAFQIACGMCFKASQPGEHEVNEEYGGLGYVPNHPNEYFIEARRRRVGGHSDAKVEHEAGAGVVIDEDIDDEEMISAALAVESSTQSQDEKEKEKEHGDGDVDMVKDGNSHEQDGKNKVITDNVKDSKDNGKTNFVGSTGEKRDDEGIDQKDIQTEDKANEQPEKDMEMTDDKGIDQKEDKTVNKVREELKKDVEMNEKSVSKSSSVDESSNVKQAVTVIKGNGNEDCEGDEERPSKLAKN